MILFFMLIVLLAIAWGLADYQLQSHIDRQPPPVAVTKPVPVVPPKVDVAPPVEESSGSNPPASGAEPTPVSDRPVVVHDSPPTPAATERAPD
ncbi:MAG: hypothetical protein Q8M11_12145 [Sulfuritalea sp.]|nr:hypothetical protein [Sulfuritalea sp.]MDP1981084.1 hypothetical protein [Sulfuritalea sp.]